MERTVTTWQELRNATRFKKHGGSAQGDPGGCNPTRTKDNLWDVRPVKDRGLRGWGVSLEICSMLIAMESAPDKADNLNSVLSNV